MTCIYYPVAFILYTISCRKVKKTKNRLLHGPMVLIKLIKVMISTFLTKEFFIFRLSLYRETMGDAFIDKIRKIILEHLENDKFGVRELASETGLSRSQLLRKVKASTGKSVNRFIRDIRLIEGARLLKDSDLTASEIAYKVGFSSPSYFNKCFLDNYRLTPGDFKKSSLPVEQKTEKDAMPTRPGRTVKPVILVIIITIVIPGFYFTAKNRINFSDRTSASIAVLPLLDLSENRDKEYLADGITEALTLELSKNESIRVISRGSSMKYKGVKKLYPEIAHELGVDLLLEGSVLYSTDSLRVVVQLIEPSPREKHVWANSYDQDHADILKLVKKVSSEIADEISTVMNPGSGENVSYRVDPEAYDLYLRGRHLYNTQKIRYYSLVKALDYLNDAIETDPGFAQAYVTMAETYIAINTLIGDNEEKIRYRASARQAINKALELDQSLAEAYITYGNIAGKFDWNWEKMKEMAETGLKIDPNNSNAYILLSNYYVVKGFYRRAIEEAMKAERLDPINPATGSFLAERYYIAGEYEESINKYKQVIELNPGYGFAWNGIGYAYYQAGDLDNTINSWRQLQYIMGNDSLAAFYSVSTFNECLNFWVVRAKNNSPRYCSNPVIISTVNMMLRDTATAMDYLEIALRYKNEDLPVMMTYPDFYSLHDNPEFRELADKIGVIIND